MKRKTFVIRNESVIEQLVAFLRSFNDAEDPYEVIVRPHKKERSLLQNSLYWKWLTVIGNEYGVSKDDVHEDLKRRFLVSIYERDDLQYCEMIMTLRKMYTQGYKEDSKKLHDQVVRLTSTTNATVKQFAEYLTEIERDAASNDIALPHPEDLYNPAMGVK